MPRKTPNSFSLGMFCLSQASMRPRPDAAENRKRYGEVT